MIEAPPVNSNKMNTSVIRVENSQAVEEYVDQTQKPGPGEIGVYKQVLGANSGLPWPCTPSLVE